MLMRKVASSGSSHGKSEEFGELMRDLRVGEGSPNSQDFPCWQLELQAHLTSSTVISNFPDQSLLKDSNRNGPCSLMKMTQERA